MQLHLKSLLGFAAALSLHGCVVAVNEGFDPRGDDLSLSGDWRIELSRGNPETPTSALCQQIGIDEVQLVLYSGSSDDSYVDSRYRYDCARGSFDTRPERVLESGTYESEWVAYDAAGDEIGRSDRTTMTIQDGHATAPTAIFTAVDTGTITVEMKWGFLNGSGDGTCAQAMVDTAEITLKGDGVTRPVTGDCRDSYEFDGVPYGTYELEVAGTNDKSDTWTVTCTGLTLENASESFVCTAEATPGSG